MKDRKKLIKSLRHLADIIENTDKFYAHDRFVFIELYINCMKTMDKYLKHKNLVTDEKCINL